MADDAKPRRPKAAPNGDKPRKADTTRNEILMAAAELFAEKGYSECNLRELADKVGMKAGSFYYHFKSKEEILDELLLASIEMVSESVKQAIAKAGPDAPIRDRLIAAMRAHITAFLSREGQSTVLMRIWENIPPALKHRNREKRREYADIWIGLIDDGMREGVLRTDLDRRVLVPFVIGTMSRSLEWFNPKYMNIDQVCDLIIRIHLDGGLTPGLRLDDAVPVTTQPKMRAL